QILWKKFMDFLKAQSAKARIKNPTAAALAFQSLHERIMSSKIKFRYLKRNFARRKLLTEKAFLKPEKASIQLLSSLSGYLKNATSKKKLWIYENDNALTSDVEQAKAEDLLPNVIRKHEETE
ncbi:3952_t:CDS:2, partial [Ambispora gerdemannii]